MATRYTVKKSCAVCGTESQYLGIGGANAFGSADLDSRPAEMQRSAIVAWVQRCPNCGYCAKDVSKSRPGADVVIGREDYRVQLNDPTCSTLANSFLCKAILDREVGDYASAAMAIMHAAWACDDSDLDVRARRCRRQAAEMLRRAEEHEQLLTNLADADTAILVDLLRRSGQQREALSVIVARREGVANDTIARMLDYQAMLIRRGDTSRHTLAEAPGEA
jgi:hypothetical protein